MSVIIKNREMPEGCVECWNRFSCKHFEISFIRLNTRHPDCPLIEVPAPHGRLIDADALKNYIENYGHTEAFAMAQIGREGKFFLMGNIIADIDEQPTVIEAEGRTEE